MQHKTSIRFYSSAEPWPRVAGVPGLALSLSSFQRGDGEGNGLKLYLRLEVEGSVIFSLLVMLGSGSLPASSSVCSFTSHYRGEFPFWSTSSLEVFLKGIHHMQLHGLSVHSAASSPYTGIFGPVS